MGLLKSSDRLKAYFVLMLGLFLAYSGVCQEQPAIWDQLDISFNKEIHIYSLELYKGSVVDSFKLTNLSTPTKASTSKIPIASYRLRPDEVALQVGMTLRLFDNALKNAPDSVLWWFDNSRKLIGMLDLLKRDSGKPTTSQRLIDTVGAAKNADKPKADTTHPGQKNNLVERKTDSLSNHPYRLIAKFVRSIDVIPASAGTRSEYVFRDTVVIPKQPKPESFRLEIQIDRNRTMSADSNILMGYHQLRTSTDSTKEERLPITTQIKRDSVNGQLLVLKVVPYDSLGHEVALCDSCIERTLYVEPYKGYDSNNINHEFWLFLGTNIDLVDGVQAQDLYFRADYLTRISRRNNWLFISFGKSRYFDYTDSIIQEPLGHLVYPPINDSLRYLQGRLTALRVSKTDNLFLNLKFLRLISSFSKSSRLFIEGGVDLQYITTTRTWQGITITDSTSKNVPYNSSGYEPYLDNYPATTISKSWNYDFSAGLMHIFNMDDLNFKTQLMFGWNYSQYPGSLTFPSYNYGVEQYLHIKSPFGRFRIDATVLNPGISLGFEIFASYQQNTDPEFILLNGDKKLVKPLFNISLAKVLDVKHIKGLLSGITPVTNN